MDTVMQMLLFSAILGVVQVPLSASFAALKYGIPWAFSNRDKLMPPLEGVGGRTARAFHNFRETFPLFAAAALACIVLGHHDNTAIWGAQLYFWGRLAYLPVYMAGIIYLRTAAWLISMAGIVMLLVSLS